MNPELTKCITQGVRVFSPLIRFNRSTWVARDVDTTIACTTFSSCGQCDKNRISRGYEGFFKVLRLTRKNHQPFRTMSVGPRTQRSRPEVENQQICQGREGPRSRSVSSAATSRSHRQPTLCASLGWCGRTQCGNTERKACPKSTQGQIANSCPFA